MSKSPKPQSLARLPRGLVDRTASDLVVTQKMLKVIKQIYSLYGFDALETPFMEYSDALGKFLPDQDRPNEGVFSFQDDDEQWLSLRYDLTAPLARYVAQNFDALPKPYRSYRQGWVFRNEKPGPGRFRQFMQFDADTVGSASPLADAEMCMMASDTLEALGLERGQYIIKVNNRKILDGIIEHVGLGGADQAPRRLIVLRALDKLDRLGIEGVRLLLGPGRKDESGDFTKGAGLDDSQISQIVTFIISTNIQFLKNQNALMTEGIIELEQIEQIVRSSGYTCDRIIIDTSIVRGLEYYTGTVFEAELTFTIEDEKGRPVRFGSVGGGGRYDGLVSRFRPEPIPATGFSIGVSRLLSALQMVNSPIVRDEVLQGPVVVLVMDREQITAYQNLVHMLRADNIRAELYLGNAGMKAQMKYADKRNAPCVVIQGSDERERGEVMIKDLIEGAKAASAITTNVEWKTARPAQFAVPVADMVSAVKDVLAQHQK